jgi:PAS domain S-box-containing protein
MTRDRARVLVVDDTDAARYSLVRALRGDGHEVIEASNGRRAIEATRLQSPDLLVLDVRLPDITGFEVTEELRADDATKSVAIVQVSASYTSADAQAQGLLRGADAYLIHPIEPQVLSATVHALLRMRKAEQDALAERTRAEQERMRAEANEQRYRFLADMVPQLVWSTDAQGNPDYFNQRWFEFAGGGEGTGQSANWIDSLHPEDRQLFCAAWEHSVETGEPLQVECRRWSPPVNAYRWLLVRSLPMRDEHGAVIRWFGTSTDIEMQKEALRERESLLQQARVAAAERDLLVAKLREESQRKNDFLAVLSHELRNPLAPIINSVHILELAPSGGEQAKRARDVIARQVHHMTRMVDDLLDVTRIAHGKVSLKREYVDLNNIVRRSAEDHRSVFNRAGIRLDVILPEQPICINGDATRLSQVVGNLLQNSAKFTPAGGVVTVCLNAKSPNEAVLCVTDTGAGIGAETMKHLFDAFVQAERTLDRSSGGLGLGLALAKGIVSLHGGAISARSEGPGKGAEFTVKFPLEKRRVPNLVLPGQQPGKEPRRVLIIEDHFDAADSLREALELCGHIVQVAHEATSGLQLARSFIPDVVLCDIGLPRVDGYAVARQIRNDPELNAMFLVALSGYASQEDRDKALDSGFDEHMAKPPRLERLEHLLSEVPRRFRTD